MAEDSIYSYLDLTAQESSRPWNNYSGGLEGGWLALRFTQGIAKAHLQFWVKEAQPWNLCLLLRSFLSSVLNLASQCPEVNIFHSLTALHHEFHAWESAEHGLCAKLNFSSFKLWVSGCFPVTEKLSDTGCCRL